MRIGIDLGGTKIEAIALSPGGTEVARRRIATPAGDYAGTVQAIADLVDELERQAGLTAGRQASVGVGMPGAISPATGLIKNANSVCLNGQPLDKDLATALRRPVRLANDANCFALSEATDGAGAGRRVVFGVIIGTGTGAGIVVDGRVLTGPNAIAGEWGHNPLPWPAAEELPGPECYCGKHGCLETWLSGPGLTRAYRDVSGQTVDAAGIAALAGQGDAVAGAVLRHYDDRLARGLASVVNVLDPDVIVLGGGMSNLQHLYDRIPELLPRHVFSDQCRCHVVQAQHGDSSGVRGAAWLWGENEQ